MPESARGEHEAEGRAVEAHQEAKHVARAADVALTQTEAAELDGVLRDAAELGRSFGRSVLAADAERWRGVLNLRLLKPASVYGTTIPEPTTAKLILGEEEAT